MLFFWIVVFIVSLFILVKGADWFLVSSQKIGLRMGLSPFVIGVTIVAIGTSLPELFSNLAAVFNGVSEVVVSNAVGSNIARVLLIIGLATIFGKRLVISRNLIDLDLPMITLVTVIFLFTAYDGTITFFESLFLIVTYFIYLGFTLMYKETDVVEDSSKPKIKINDYFMLIIGLVGLTVGAKYLIDSIEALSLILNIGVGLITITAVALGTSVPELTVSIKAALRKQSDIALGNILGANIFNVLITVGLPGIFSIIKIDSQTLAIGLPVLIISTLLFVISGLSRRIHVQEGVMFILIYILFITKLFGLF